MVGILPNTRLVRLPDLPQGRASTVPCPHIHTHAHTCSWMGACLWLLRTRPHKQVAGFAENYDVTGNATARRAVEHFFSIVTQHHSFATGGSNDHEFWWGSRGALLHAAAACRWFRRHLPTRCLRSHSAPQPSLVHGSLAAARLPSNVPATPLVACGCRQAPDEMASSVWLVGGPRCGVHTPLRLMCACAERRRHAAWVVGRVRMCGAR